MKNRVALAVALAITATAATAGTTAQLSTPHTIALASPVNAPRCSAWEVTTAGYKTVVTGFTADGNYVTGQVSAYFTCGSSGRGGGGIHTYYSCAQLTWDLTGALVSATDTIEYTASGAPVSYNCPDEALTYPPNTPPGGSTVGNEFTNSGGYQAETVLVEGCGSEACYATYFYPTLVTP